MSTVTPTIKWTAYILEDPYPKQLAALMLPNFEVFFGGAAGPGKSSWLLMSALQYVDIPEYAAIIFRKTFADLSKPGALIDRSHSWLSGTDARWNSQNHQWRFPSGATLSFGYMADEKSKYVHQGAEYQFVGFDEVVQIDEPSYKYMFSRLRKPRCGRHWNTTPDPNCKECRRRTMLANVPLRIRAASNPPGAGQFGDWVKERFRIKKVNGIYRGTHPNRAYVPAFIEDNPSIDKEAYARALNEMDPITRAQLLEGDWGAETKGRFKHEWFIGRTWNRSPDGHTWLLGVAGITKRANLALPNPYNSRFHNIPGLSAPPKTDANREFPEAYHSGEIFWFVMVDPAASQREGPGDADIFLKKQPSWSVIGLFGLTRKHDLIIGDVVRFQKEIPEVIQGVHGALRRWNRWGLQVNFTGVEANGVGKAVYQQLQRDGVPVIDISRHTVDKLIYATPAMNRVAQGKVYLPSEECNLPWRDPFYNEITHFTGHPYEVNDQVDILSHACQFAHTRATVDEQSYPGDLDSLLSHFD